MGVLPRGRLHRARLKSSALRPRARVRRDAGTFGKKIVSKREADPSQKGAPMVDVSKRETDRKKVNQTGLLAILNARDAAARSSVFGPAGRGAGINDPLGGPPVPAPGLAVSMG